MSTTTVADMSTKDEAPLRFFLTRYVVDHGPIKVERGSPRMYVVDEVLKQPDVPFDNRESAGVSMGQIIRYHGLVEQPSIHELRATPLGIQWVRANTNGQVGEAEADEVTAEAPGDGDLQEKADEARREWVRDEEGSEPAPDDAPSEDTTPGVGPQAEDDASTLPDDEFDAFTDATRDARQGGLSPEVLANLADVLLVKVIERANEPTKLAEARQQMVQVEQQAQTLVDQAESRAASLAHRLQAVERELRERDERITTLQRELADAKDKWGKANAEVGRLRTQLRRNADSPGARREYPVLDKLSKDNLDDLLELARTMQEKPGPEGEG